MSNTSIPYEFSSHIVEEVLCSYCNAYVSCGPVKVRQDGGTICGRCSPSNGEGSVRHILFETVMSKFTFPCRYKQQGCEQRLLFGAIEHEDVCPFRTFSCPSLPHGNCAQDVSLFDVYKHFEEAHGDLIIKDEQFKLDLQVDSQQNLLMNKKSLVAAVLYKFDSLKGVLNLDVTYFSSGPQEGTSYQLQIISGSDSDHTLSFKKYTCERYECHAISQRARSFEMNNYLPALENPSFVFIKIMLQRADSGASYKGEHSQAIIKSASLASPGQEAIMAWNSLDKFRCNLCRCYPIPPVFKLSAGNLCYECKTERNISATEQFVKVSHFPCRWRGCSFIGNEVTIRNHDENCQFRTYICPLYSNCQSGFYTRNTVMSHVQQHGGHYCTDPEKIVVELFHADCVVNKYFTIFHNELIAFTCTIVNNFQWSLHFGRNDKFAVDIYFEHDHCSVKSTVFSYSKLTNYHSSNYSSKLPGCFTFCKNIWAVLKIKDQKN